MKYNPPKRVKFKTKWDLVIFWLWAICVPLQAQNAAFRMSRHEWLYAFGFLLLTLMYVILAYLKYYEAKQDS